MCDCGKCRECKARYAREYRAKNRDLLRQKEKERHKKRRQDPKWVENERKRGREYWQNLRREALDAYGGVCSCCGESEELFLTFDHVNNDGAEHRRELTGRSDNGKGASSATLSWMKKEGYPDSIQILCMNCNMGKQRNGGVCPHSTHRTT